MPQPTTPNPSTLDPSAAGWETTLNSNFEGIENHLANPLPVKWASTSGGLPSAATYDKCIALYGTTPRLVFSDGATWKELVPINGLPYVMVSQHAGSGVNAGNATAGSWFTRNLTQMDADTHGIATFQAANDRVQLPAGTYLCHIVVEGMGVHSHQARLYSDDLGSALLAGSLPYCNTTGNLLASNYSVIQGYFGLASPWWLKVQQKVSISKAADGLGYAVTQNVPGTDLEFYVKAEFWKVA